MVRALGHSAVVASGLASALTVWRETGRAFDPRHSRLLTWVLTAELRSASPCNQKSRISRASLTYWRLISLIHDDGETLRRAINSALSRAAVIQSFDGNGCSSSAALARVER